MMVLVRIRRRSNLSQWMRLQYLWAHIFVVLIWGASSGCIGSKQIDREYGKVNSNSVNGTGVLAQMFREAGFRVSTWRRLSPKLKKEHVIVWAPDSHRCPSTGELDYLENWLRQDSRRTLIYIGRSYDAAVDYWKAIQKNAMGQQAIEIRRRLAKLLAEQRAASSYLQNSNTCDWFKFEPASRTTSRGIGGRWSEICDFEQTTIDWDTRISEPGNWNAVRANLEFETLLSANENAFAVRIHKPYDYGGDCIVFANGSTLLNLPLVNHEHRRIAGQLIRECTPASRVTFLESGEYGIPIMESDSSPPIMLRAFTTAPMKFLMLHLTVLGVLYCLSVFPIFGRPKQIVESSPSDFGKHVTAFGELLQKSDGRNFVAEALIHVRDSHGK